MKDFTLKNIFKYWIKLWPVTVALFVLGCAAGLYLVKSVTNGYQSAAQLLVRNSDSNAQSTDYVALVQSELVLKDAAIDGCEAIASGAGNVVEITTTCEDSPETAKNFTNTVAQRFSEKAKEIYGADDFELVRLGETSEATPMVTTKNKIMKFMVPVVAALAGSLAVAFIGLDIKVSKKK